MKKYLTLSNLFLLVSFVASIVIAIVFPTALSWLIFVSATSGILYSKFATEGKWFAFVFDIISYAVYIVVCWHEKYFGELILSCILIVFETIIMFEWKKHKENKKVIVNSLKAKEYALILFLAVVSIAIYYVVLYFLGTDMPFLNAIPTVVYLLGIYFALRRCRAQFWCYMIYQLSAGVLWVVSACDGQIGSIILLIGFVSEFIYNLFGIINWKKIKTSQRDTVEIILKIVKQKL